MSSFDVVQLSSETYATEYYSSSQPYDEITLEYVSGVSCKSKGAISANPCNGNVAFVASSVLVLSDPQYPNQAFIENPTAREIGCVTFSDDGRYLAYGELGHNPSVSVFNAKQFTRVNSFKIQEGRCSIKALQFHPRGIYLAMLMASDYGILVYEFVHGRRLAAAKWCVEPLAMTMTRKDCTLAVCGHRKISCFSLSNVESSRYETNAMLDRRAVLLGKQGNYTFVDIVGGQNRFVKCIYTVTSCGFLCDIKSGVVKDVVKVSNRCFCVKFSLGLLFVGCENGIVNICNPENLGTVASIDDSDLFGRDRTHPINWSVKCDIVALAINPKTKIVTTLMSNQQMHSWYIEFVDNGFECSPVIVSESGIDTKSRTSKIMTSHDLNCTLAQLLIQLEMSNHYHRNDKKNFLQRQPTSRFRQFNAIKITPDGKDIIVGNKTGEIKVYEATTGILKKIIEAHNAEVTYVEVMYDSDFKLVATGGRDRVIFIFNAQKDYRLVQAVNDHSSAIVSISLAHNNGLLTLVSSSKDGVILIRRAPREETPKFITIGELPECVGSRKRAYNHSSGYIITGQEKGRINVFPFDPHINLKPITKIQVGNAFLKSVAIDPTSSFFVAFGTEGQYVFHLQTGQQIATLCYLPGFNHLSFSQDLNYFINSNDAGCKFLWRLPTKIVEVMHANLKDMSSMVLTSREFVFNSYMSCVRVCQHVVGDEEEGSSTLKASGGMGSSDGNLDEFENFVEDNHSLTKGNAATFPVTSEKKRSHVTMTEKGQEIMNLLCDDTRRGGLVESASYTSCCTTYSRSLTDMAPLINLISGAGGDEFTKSSATGSKKQKSHHPLDRASADIMDKLHTLMEMKDSVAIAKGGNPIQMSRPGSSQSTNSSSAQNTATCQLAEIFREPTPGHVADGEDKGETSESARDRDKGKISLEKLAAARSQSPSVRLSDFETRIDFVTVPTHHSHDPANCPTAQDRVIRASVPPESETLSTMTNEVGTRGSTSNLTSNLEGQLAAGQAKDSEKADYTSQMKDSGVVEDLPTDYTVIDTQLEDNTTARIRSFKSSTKSADNLLVENSKCTGVHEDITHSPHVVNSKDAAKVNEVKHASSTVRASTPIPNPTHTSTPTPTPGYQDLDSLRHNLESLCDLEDTGQLQEYYTEFCRNIHLSNSQETYVLKEQAGYDIINNMARCLDDASHYDASARVDSGKASGTNTATVMSIDHSDIPSSIETRMFGPHLSKDSTTGHQGSNAGQSELELYQHDVNLRRVFLSWVRRKLNKERKRKKQMKALGHGQTKSEGQGQCPRPDSPSKGISQDGFHSETLLEEISTTTDTDFVTTESNVTWASNTSVCKEAMANREEGEGLVHIVPSHTASEPLPDTRFGTAVGGAEVGVVQWQRSVHYASTASLQSRTTSTSYSPSRSTGGAKSLSPEMSHKSGSHVGGAEDGSNSSDNRGVAVVGSGGGGCGGGGGGGVGVGGSCGYVGGICSCSVGSVISRKSDKFCQPCTRSATSSQEKCSPHKPCEPSATANKSGKRSSAAATLESMPHRNSGGEGLGSIPTLDNTGGMASLFRNQDDYLRKLKEVRRNFEKSIQELSNERRNQQIEAQKYFMKQ